MKEHSPTALLKVFLPKTMSSTAISNAVLLDSLASVLVTLQSLAHMSDLERALTDANNDSFADKLSEVHRPLGRLPSMTAFKKLVLTCYESQSVVEMDQQAAEQAKQVSATQLELKDDLDKLLDSAKQKTLSLQGCVQMIGKMDKFMTLAATLPVNEQSQHFSERQEALQMVMKDCDCDTICANKNRKWFQLELKS